MTKLLIFIIKIYQFLISPFFVNKCRFLPSCSEYFLESLKIHGFSKGIFLGVKRILRCHPFKSLGGGNGVDIVPILKKTSKENKNGQ